jgi:hypothetical protein
VQDTFRVVEANGTLTLNGRGGLVESAALVIGPTSVAYFEAVRAQGGFVIVRDSRPRPRSW